MAVLVFQQSLDDNKNNNDPERTFGLTHTRHAPNTPQTRHPFAITAEMQGDHPVYSALLSECVLHFGLPPEYMKETVFGKEKNIFLLNIIVTVTEQ